MPKIRIKNLADEACLSSTSKKTIISFIRKKKSCYIMLLILHTCAELNELPSITSTMVLHI